MHIVIIDDYADSVRTLTAFERIRHHSVKIYCEPVRDSQQWAERLAHAHVLIPIRERSTIDQSVLNQAPHLRMVSCAGTLPGNLDLAYCSNRKIAVAQSRGSGHATAELCWALILAAQRRLLEQITTLRAGKWQGPLGRQLYGRRLGLWGFGRVAQQVANYGKAFGMQVWVWGRASTLERARQAGWQTADSRESFIAESDVLSVHLKLTAQTAHSITKQDLGLMKSDAVFVNTARAGLLAPGALEAALDTGRPGSAAIDVFDDEPLVDTSHTLLTRGNVIATPHVGFVEKDNFESFFDGAFENLLRFEAGEIAHLINHEAFRNKA